jgi:hypothetical protein
MFIFPRKPVCTFEIFVNKLSSLGYDSSKCGLHSYWSGGATTAANNGVSNKLIKKQGRWKTEVSKDKNLHESESSKKLVSLKNELLNYSVSVYFLRRFVHYCSLLFSRGFHFPVR